MGKNENNLTNMVHFKGDTINKIATTRQQHYKLPSRNQPDIITIEDRERKYYKCGQNDHRANECEHITNICKRCNRRGHLQKVYMQRKLHRNQINLKDTSLANEIHTGDERDR